MSLAIFLVYVFLRPVEINLLGLAFSILDTPVSCTVAYHGDTPVSGCVVAEK